MKRLRDTSRARPRSLGFGRRDEEKRTLAMVLVAQVDGLDARAAAAAVGGGASAVAFVLEASEAASLARGQTNELDHATAACGDAVPGLLLAGEWPLPTELAAQIQARKVDFVIVRTQRAPASLVGSGETALVVQVDDPVERPALLRGLGELKVDAVLAGPPQPGSDHRELTVYDLMVYKLVVESVRQPVLVAVDRAIRPEDLQALRDVGVDGIVMPPGTELARYAEAIAKLKIKPRGAGRASDGMALLPRAIATAASAESEDEDDD